MKFGSEGNKPGELCKPFGLAVDEDGNIYIADTFNHRIQKFDDSGQFLAEYGSYGFGSENFRYPRKVAIGKNGLIVVLDGYNHRIQRINKDGEFLSSINSVGSEPGYGQFANPLGMALDTEDNIYIADPNNSLIQKFNADGLFLMQFGSFGVKEGQFDWPYGLGIDTNKNIYVADTENNRIQKFSSDGTFIAKFGSELIGEGEFKFPVKPAIDSEGNVYVLDVSNENIQKFDKHGRFLNEFGAVESYNGKIPGVAIAIDSKDYLYVINISTFSVQKYHLNGKLIHEFDYRGYGPLGNYIKPTGLSVDLEGNIYVVQESGPRIQKFTNNGEFLFQFSFPDSVKMQFYRATGVTTDQEGNLYVSDSGGWNIRKFDSEGKFISKFGYRGLSDGQFEYPNDVAVDTLGNIFVSEQHNLIQKFSPNGTFLAKIGSFGVEEGQLRYPRALQIDNRNNIYVVDFGNKRIQKFRPFPTNFKFFADTVKGLPNEIVKVSVKVNDFNKIISAQSTLEWNPNIAELISAEATSLPHTEFSTTSANRGKMTFSWYERNNAEGLSLSDSSTLFTLHFRMLGKPKEQTALSFTSNITPTEVAYKDGSIVEVSLQSGNLCILPLSQIRGKITTANNQPVKGAEIILKGYASDLDSTDVQGKFELTGVHPYQSYTVTASKEFDANYANGLTSLDLAILQRHILEVETLTSLYKLIAADVDLSQNITTADIRDIQNVVLGNADRLAKGKHWTFIPTKFTFDNPAHPYPYDTVIVYDAMPSTTGHDFIGIKLGDVNDTWNPTKSRQEQQPLQFLVEAHETFIGDSITVPVKAADFRDVSSFQLTLEWDPAVLSFASAQGQALPGVVFGDKYTTEGQLTVLWYNLQGGSTSVSGEEVLFNITFKTVGNIGEQSTIAINSARTPLLAYDTSNVPMDAEAVAGEVSITELSEVLGISDSDDQISYKLYQNMPNPFVDELNFKFTIPQKATVTIQVINTMGGVIYETEKIYQRGSHTVSWDTNNSEGLFISPGIYYIKLGTDAFQETIKIVKN